MKSNNLFRLIFSTLIFSTFITIFSFGKVIKSEASPIPNQVKKATIELGKELSDDDILQSGLLKWDLEVGNKTFQVCVDRENETVTIRGEVKDLEQKNRAEHILKLRSPGNLRIINEIEIP